MPIKRGQDDVPRIYLKNKGPIRRGYLGNKLVYGLYDVRFFDRTFGVDYEPKIYAWGYEDECIEEFEIPWDAPEYVPEDVDKYLTHWGDSNGENGWCEDNTLLIPKKGILLNDHRNLTLYGRWRQHRFTYNSKVAYEEWEEYPVYDIDKRKSIDNPTYMGLDNSYYWDNSPGMNPYATGDGTWGGTNCLPNCTCYAYGRCLEVGISEPVYGTPSGSGWGRASSKYDIIDYDRDKLEPGDCISWRYTTGGDSAGHVAFYEGNGMVSASGWINSAYYYKQFRSTWFYDNYSSRTYNDQLHAFNYMTIEEESTWGGNGDEPYKIIKTSEGLDPSYEWRKVRDVVVNGPSGEVSEPDYPEVPETGIGESDEIRNVRYESFTAMTDERQIHYPVGGYGSWEDDWVSVDSDTTQPSVGESWVSGWSETWS